VSRPPRVAFMADSFHEINGAARTCRELQAYASRKQLPFLSIHGGEKTSFTVNGSVQVLELERSKLSIPVDADLKFDPLFYKQRELVEEKLREFQPDLVHLTSPGDIGILGAIAADDLKVPLVLSWHTNLHEFAARRFAKVFRWAPSGLVQPLAQKIEDLILGRVVWFFGRGKVLMAPSPELVELLESRTGRPTLYMGRGVDTKTFSPEQRDREDDVFTIGYVGRLMPEKNVRFLAKLEQELEKAGHTDFRIVMVGDGMEKAWLGKNIKRGRLTGILLGDDLGREYANFDAFAFPSRTDTFGQVIQEAHSSGVPTVVTNHGGPQFLVEPGKTGFVAQSDEEFVEHIIRLKGDPELRERMGQESRRQCYIKCWDRTFVETYKAYELSKPLPPGMPTAYKAGELVPQPVQD